jgi:hypothetical protein
MAGKRPGLRNETKGGPSSDVEPRANSESPEHISSPGSGGGGSSEKSSVGQSYATAAAMMPPASPAQPEPTKAKNSIGGTKKGVNKGKANTSGAAEETTVDNDFTASDAKWKAAYEGLKTTMTFCKQPLPLAIIEKLVENGLPVKKFAVDVEIADATTNGTPETITAEILDEFRMTLFREYQEYITEESTKAAEGKPKSAETKNLAQERSGKRKPTGPLHRAQFRGPSDTDMQVNSAGKRAQKLSSADLTAGDEMIRYADLLITSIANNDHSAVQRCKVGLASSSAYNLSIEPANVVGSVASCATAGVGSSGRVFSFASESDDENDDNFSLENSSDLGVRPRAPGRKSYTRENVEAEAEGLVKSAVAALNDGYEDDVLPPDIFKTEVARIDKDNECYVIRVTPEVYLKLRERSVANKRIKDALLKALRLLLQKKNVLDPISMSKLQAILVEHERVDRMTAEQRARYMCALPIDEDPSMLGVAFSQTAPGLNVGVNIIEEIHNTLFDHENAQGIQSLCRFASDQVVVKMKPDGTFDRLRTAWNKVLTGVQRHSKRSPLGLPWELYGFMVDDDGMPLLLSNDNLARMFLVHCTLKLSRQRGYQRLQEKYAPASLTAELVATLGEKELMEFIAWAEKEVESELPQAQKPQRQAESATNHTKPGYNKPVYNNLGNGAAFVATAEQAPFTSQRKASQGPTGGFLDDYSFWAGIGQRALESSNNAVEATTAVAKALNEHSGGTVFSSISPTCLVLRPGTTWNDNSYSDSKTTAGIRYLKDTIGICDNTKYFSLVPGTADLQQLRNKLAKTMLPMNTRQAADSQKAAFKQNRNAAPGKGIMGKGAPNWNQKGKGGKGGKGTSKAIAAAAMTYGNDGADGGYGGYGGDSDYGGGSSGSKSAGN